MKMLEDADIFILLEKPVDDFAPLLHGTVLKTKLHGGLNLDDSYSVQNFRGKYQRLEKWGLIWYYFKGYNDGT